MSAPGLNSMSQFNLTEQRRDRLWRLVCNRQGLNAQLLLELQGLQVCRFRSQVSIDKSADTALDCIAELRSEGQLRIHLT